MVVAKGRDRGDRGGKQVSFLIDGDGELPSLSSVRKTRWRELLAARGRSGLLASEGAKPFPVEQLRAEMVGTGYRDSHTFLDEIPQANKDIDQVSADAADLVEVRHPLRQIVNVKGD